MFCDATTQGQQGQASFDAHHDAFTVHPFFMLICVSQAMYTWLQAKKSCSVSCSAETGHSHSCPFADARNVNSDATSGSKGVLFLFVKLIFCVVRPSLADICPFLNG